MIFFCLFVVFFGGVLSWCCSGFLLRLRTFEGLLFLPTTNSPPSPPIGAATRVDTAMSVNDDALHPDVDGGGGASGNANYVPPWTADPDALCQHVDTRLDQQVDNRAQMKGMLQDAEDALPLPGLQQGAPLGGNELANAVTLIQAKCQRRRV